MPQSNNGAFNQFEGMDGDDAFTGNFNTRAVYTNAAAAVTVADVNDADKPPLNIRVPIHEAKAGMTVPAALTEKVVVDDAAGPTVRHPTPTTTATTTRRCRKRM